MQLAEDFEDFIRLLNKHSVAYMVVGGYALAFHGKPGYTGDLDIWISVSEDNAAKMLKVIRGFGFASLGLSKSDFLNENFGTQIGYPPLRIDILNTISGVSFEEAYPHKEVIDVDGLPVNFIGLGAFIKNKTASGRAKDIVDIKSLKKPEPKTRKKKK